MNQNDNNDLKQRAERLLPINYFTTATKPFSCTTIQNAEDTTDAGYGLEDELDGTTGSGDSGDTSLELYNIAATIKECLACLEYTPVDKNIVKREANKQQQLDLTVSCLTMIEEVLGRVKQHLNKIIKQP